jgi:hypothetical protein
MEFIFGVIALLSLGMTIGMAYFFNKLLKKVLYFNDNIEMLLLTLEGFYKHLEEFNSLEAYSNEPVVMNLLDHSKDAINDIEDFFNELDLTAHEEKEEEK